MPAISTFRVDNCYTDQAQVAVQLLAEGKAVRDIARTFNVHEATIYRLAAL